VTFLDWVNMSIIVDIASIVFFVAVAWKLNKLQSKISQVESDLLVTMKNPQAAKRLLKERQQ
tara:strand:- start:802 stop:987 length:186 start_codon:yes stop_codon:yes gene_type:complete